jgi:hypothetical protein
MITFIKDQAIPGDMVQRASSATEVGGDGCVCCEHYVLPEQISNTNALLGSMVTMYRNSPGDEVPANT